MVKTAKSISIMEYEAEFILLALNNYNWLLGDTTYIEKLKEKLFNNFQDLKEPNYIRRT